MWATARDVQQRFMAPVCVARASELQRPHRRWTAISFDFVPLPYGRLSLTIGDASRKGLAAAFMIGVRSSESDNYARVAGIISTLHDGGNVLERAATASAISTVPSAALGLLKEP